MARSARVRPGRPRGDGRMGDPDGPRDPGGSRHVQRLVAGGDSADPGERSPERVGRGCPPERFALVRARGTVRFRGRGSVWPSDPLGLVARGASAGLIPATAANHDAIGPLWLGPLGDSAVVRELQPSGWTSVSSARLLSLLKTESEMPPFFVTTDELAAREHRPPPKLDRFIDGLRAIGHRATRTHFHPRGVKTDAPSRECARLFRDLSPTGSMGDSGPAS